MLPVAIIIAFLIAGILAWLWGRRRPLWTRYLSLGTTIAAFALAVISTATSRLTTPLHARWLPELGVSFHFATDGLGLSLIALTCFLGAVSVVISWRDITERVGFFHFNVLWILAGIVGVFSAFDLFLFYFFWELMLVPMYLLIAIWGHERRAYASIKFFIFTQASGLLMFISIIALYMIHLRLTGTRSFDYFDLKAMPLAFDTSLLIMLGFFIAFAVKLPMLFFHTWLPDAHTEAPTAGSVILAGLLLKTGGYGFLRFVLPMFPSAAQAVSTWAMALGAAGIVYGAVIAFSQTDLKRLVAYTSVSHLGFVLFGAFAGTALARQGAIFEMLTHGLSTGALFVLVGMIQERIATRDVRRMGGFWESAPKMGGFALLFALASLGLPGLGNFIAEILVLFGGFQANRVLTAIATMGFIFGTIYSLWIVQRVFHGAETISRIGFRDLDGRETIVFASLAAVLVWLGVYPQPVLNLIGGLP